MKRKIFYTLLILFLLQLFFIEYVFAKDVRIGLVTSENEIKITANKKAKLINLFNGNLISNINRESFSVQNKNGLISVSSKTTNTNIGAFTGPVKLIVEEKDGLVFCDKSWYRGNLLISPATDKKNLTVVNVIDLESYLLSVVPSEIPEHWAKEALKAQAVAARSYTLGYLGRRKEKGYDLESSVEDQVYAGVKSERQSTSNVVKETEGEILIDKRNKPLIALYHSSGGGYTDNIENLWDEKANEHIMSGPDYDDSSPHFKWTRSFKIEEVNKSLNALNIGEVIDVVPLSRSYANRVMWIKIKGTQKEEKIRGEEFRKFLKLPSSKFNIILEDGIVKIAGRGFGHGLGLSQWGAKALADNGFTYDEILAHYYPGTRLVKAASVKY